MATPLRRSGGTPDRMRRKAGGVPLLHGAGGERHDHDRASAGRKRLSCPEPDSAKHEAPNMDAGCAGHKAPVQGGPPSPAVAQRDAQGRNGTIGALVLRPVLTKP